MEYNSNISLDQYEDKIIECCIHNIYYFNESNYPHVNKLKNDRKNFLMNYPNVTINMNNMYNEIIKIIYDNRDINNNQVNRFFSFESIDDFYRNQNTDAKIYLIKTTLFSWDDKNLDDLIEKLTKRISYNNYQRSHYSNISVDYIGYLNRDRYTISLNTNSNKGNFNIYFFLIISTDTCCFTQPFTLMTIKNFSKRSDRDTYLHDLEKSNKIETLAYYYKTIFNEGNNMFTNNINYRMNTHFLNNDEIGIHYTNDDNTLPDISINILLNIFKEYKNSFEKKINRSTLYNSLFSNSILQNNLFQKNALAINSYFNNYNNNYNDNNDDNNNFYSNNNMINNIYNNNNNNNNNDNNNNFYSNDNNNNFYSNDNSNNNIINNIYR
eukprot:jgi/Orpsp1_1/1190220/evm.model.d7180000077522.1